MMHSYLVLGCLKEKFGLVLILVVMDDALVPTSSGSFGMQTLVLILVVMDDALVQIYAGKWNVKETRLNPCCNG